MAPTLRDALHVVLNRPRVFALAAAALLGEAAVRLALVVVHPVLTVAFPPVVALPVLAAAAPTVRAALETPDAPPQWTAAATLRDRAPRLLAVAVGGHLVALALGTAAFLLVDTPLRAAVYATGGSLSPTTVLVAPLAGVAAGALLAWAVLAPAVERVVAGDRLRAAAAAPLHAAGNRRRTATALALHAACVLAAGLFVGALASGQYATRDVATLAFLATVGAGAGTLVLLGMFVYPMHVALAASEPREPRSVPVRRVALAALLVAGLVAGASAVRVTETRPGTATAASPLPADASDAYAAALDNTGAADHRVVATEQWDGDRAVATTVVERSARQFRASLRHENRTDVGYADSGVAYQFRGYTPGFFRLGAVPADGDTAHALPGYWQVSDDYTVTEGVGIGYGLPAARTGSWTTVERAGGTRTLELTGDAAVFEALQGSTTGSVTAETARIRMRVDAERGVVLGGRARLNATVDGTRLVRNVGYTVETGRGVDARRPAALGSRSLGELAWDVFAY
ncbi:uncharacterized protein HHUB_2597 [Halobacterium hubeiense]|uniref:Uncharacterized protein n=1 Tax=Halobacterium hubeiense TaxID=1407499 RepID=A0A0U5CYR1_9EURY|nr:hypothetical protein [Halobacterium hubeiense]CQH57766.1 uncharacterized protein HHUB_2597 [Halobacterium hubeiense]